MKFWSWILSNINFSVWSKDAEAGLVDSTIRKKDFYHVSGLPFNLTFHKTDLFSSVRLRNYWRFQVIKTNSQNSFRRFLIVCCVKLMLVSSDNRLNMSTAVIISISSESLWIQEAYEFAEPYVVWVFSECPFFADHCIGPGFSKASILQQKLFFCILKAWRTYFAHEATWSFI